MVKDKRPDPRARKNPHLWQVYLMWEEIVEMRKRHVLRISSIERGKSNLDADLERQWLGTASPELGMVEGMYKTATKLMHDQGQALGPIWDWLIDIKGIGPNLAAKLLALIDYPAPFPGSYPGHCDTISKLRRFAGYAVIDGEIDRATKGNKIPYNKTLKSVLWQVCEQFIRHQTPHYADIYYERKEREYRLHPAPICSKCGGEGIQVGKRWKCGQCGQAAGINGKGWGLRYTPAHLDQRARRQVIKYFLTDLWLKWREFEGLPISEPYEKAILGHTNIVTRN